MQATWYRRPAFKRVGPQGFSNPANDDIMTAELNMYEKEVVAEGNSLLTGNCLYKMYWG